MRSSNLSKASDRLVILDGGLSNALEDRGHDLSDALWSARLLRDDPAEIAAVHRAYYEAGAMVATTASYQASVIGFERAGVERAEAERLIASSVRIAREVRDEFPGRLSTMTRAARTGDGKAVERLAHSIKSTSGSLGAFALMASSAEIERLAGQGQLDLASLILDRLRDEFAEVRPRLQAERDR